MARLPVDFKEVVDAIGDIDAARQQPVSVAVYLDSTAPKDLLDFVHACFVSTEPNAHVTVSYYRTKRIELPLSCDLAVIAAGHCPYTGAVAQGIREAGVPVLVATTMPEMVKQVAASRGTALLNEDVVFPEIEVRPGALPADSVQDQEPYPLNENREKTLRRSMGAWIVDVFREKKLAFALCFPFVRESLALDAVRATSAQNAAIGAVVIIPGADMPIMTLNQAKMILQIAAAYGQKMGMERARELIAVIAGAFVFRAFARQVAGSVPGLGWLVKGAIGYVGTFAMGHAAIAFFDVTVAQGRPVKEAIDAARAEAERMAAIARQEANPASAAKAVAQDYARSAAEAAQDVASRAVPAVQDVVNSISQVAGTTNPAELGKKAVDTFCEVAGTTPEELGHRIVSAAFGKRAEQDK